MRVKTALSLLVVSLAVLISSGFAQPTTGTPKYGSFLSTPAGSVNLGNLNLHLAIPVVQKQGRGTPFTYSILYDSSIWYPVTVNGTKTWQPVANFGWSADALPSLGYLSYSSWQTSCYSDTRQKMVYTVTSNFVYTDKWGGQHSFPNTYFRIPGACEDDYDSPIDDQPSDDGSGYVLSKYSITDPSGAHWNPPSARGTSTPATYTDTNGNQISLNNGVFTDTLGTNALTITGSGTVASPIVLQYATPAGSATYTLNYTSYNVKTNFACTGINQYSASNVPLVTSITLPDKRTYQFTYEDTPGYSSYKTGRIAGIQLLTGGKVSLTYTGDIVCSDGSTAGVIITTPDGTTSLTRNGTNTTLIAPPANGVQTETDFAFQVIAKNPYEANRSVYDISSSKNLLETISTTRTSTNPQPTQVTTTLPSGFHKDMTYSWSSYGQLLSEVDYDWTQGAGLGTPLKTTSIVYQSGFDSKYLTASLFNLPWQVQVRDGTSAGTLRSSTTYGYDGKGAVTSCPVGLPSHDDVNYGCANGGTGTSSTYPRGLVTSLSRFVPGGSFVTTAYTYDVFGNLLTSTAGGVLQSTAAYSGTNNYAVPDSVTLGSGSMALKTSYQYDPSTYLVTKTTDPNNGITTQSYDIFSRPLVTQRPDQRNISRSYDDQARTVTTTTPFDGSNTLVSKTFADSMGRVYQVQYPTGAVQTQFDSLGRNYKVSNPYTLGGSPSYWTTTVYDALGREKSISTDDGATSTISYSPVSNVPYPAVTTDPAGHQRMAAYDGLGRLTSAYEPDANNALTTSTSYTYTALGSLTSVTQGSQTRSFTYDGLNRVTSATTPEGGTVSYTYDSCSPASSNMCTRTDARGVKTSYQYDLLNRIKTISYDVSGDSTGRTKATAGVAYAYGTNVSNFNNGRLTSVTDGLHQEAYTYDILGNVLEVDKTIQTQTYKTYYAFDAGGALTALTYPSGMVLTNHYSSDGTLQSITDQNGRQLVSGLAYNPAGQVTNYSMGLSGGTVEATLGYNQQRSQLQALSYDIQGGNTLFSLGYGYAPSPNQLNLNNGQILAITDNLQPGRSATYGYDALNRLIAYSTAGSTQYPAQNMSWTYDRYGNRLTQTQNGSQLTSYPDGTTNRIGSNYDANGNVTSDGAYGIIWDAENRMVSYGANLTNEYDGNGIRIRRTGPSSDVVYIFGGSRPLAEYAPGAVASIPNTEYIYLGGLLLASKANGAYTFYVRDHLSIRQALADANPNNPIEAGLLPFGEPWYGGGNKWAFTSYERDTDIGDDYAMARRYSYRSGRFNSPDPISGSTPNPQSWNRYSYALNSPVVLADPAGLSPQDQHEFFTYWLASVAGRPDASGLAEGAYLADTPRYAAGFPDGLYDGGMFCCMSMHFGTPERDQFGNFVVGTGRQGGFDLHLIEDNGAPNAPHSVGLWGHILGNILGRSPDTAKWASGGFAAAGNALGIPAGDDIYGALEETRQFLNEHGLSITGLSISGVDMNGNQIESSLGATSEGAEFYGSFQSGGWTVNIYQIAATPFYDLPTIQAIIQQSLFFGGGGCNTMCENELLYDEYVRLMSNR